MRELVNGVGRVVLGRPRTTIVLMLAVGLLAAFGASRLTFDTRFDALLRDDAPELQEVRELQKRAGGTVQLILAVGGKPEARLPFARDVVRQLRGKPFVQHADVEFPVEFFLDRRLYFLSVAELKDLQRQVDRELERAKLRANPFYVDLEEDDAPTGARADSATKQAQNPFSRLDQGEAFEGKRSLLSRTFESANGKYLFVRIKAKGTSYDMAAGAVIYRQICQVVEALGPKQRGVELRYAGALPSNQEQHVRMNADLRRASVLSLLLILLLMTVYIRRLAAPLVMALPLMVGVTLTLALTAIFIGQLNLVSGFLVSALIGLGIDFEIHLYLRYLEELDRGRARIAAMQLAISKTITSCTTAATTTAAAFYAIAIADFRGFREYGLIAGTGVLITLAVTYVMLPPLAVLVSGKGKRGLRLFSGTSFRRRFAISMVVVGVLFLAYSLTVIQKVRWHSNFRQLRGTSAVVDFTASVEEALGGSLSPAAIYVDTTEQARQVQAYLEPLTNSPDSGVRRSLALADMLPPRQAEKRQILSQLERSLLRVLGESSFPAGQGASPVGQGARGAKGTKLIPEDRKHIDQALVLARAKPWSEADIPEVFRRSFRTVDNRGQFVVVWPRSEMVEDLDIIAWGQELNRIRAELRARGIPAKILGENRIGARVLGEMRSQAPVIMIAAALAVLVILIHDTRNMRAVILIAGSLSVGLCWMLGVMYLMGLEINVFNQAVLATIIGLGLDNAVHVQHRYAEEGPGSLPKVIATTGAASFLATGTTAIGFGAAVTASHAGVQSLGWLAIAGFACTFISSTVFFPAVLRLLECAMPVIRRSGEKT